MHPEGFMSLWYVQRKPCTNLAPTLTLSPNSLKRDSSRPTSPRSSIGCVQNHFQACGTFDANHTPILHRHQYCLQMERSEIPHDQRHLGVPSGASKMISDPMVRFTQTVLLSCIKISTMSERPKQASYGTSSANHAPLLHRY